MRFSSRAVGALTAALIAIPTFASAQMTNTGQNTTGTTDNAWTLWFCPLNSSGVCSSAPVMQSGVVIEPSIVAGNFPTWFPNGSPYDANWIGQNERATIAGGASAGQRDFRYVFATNLNGTDPFQFAYNTDNFFNGWMVSGAGAPDMTLAGYADGTGNQSGFCRSPDGAFGPPCPSLSPPISVGARTADANTLYLSIDGDGTTDGLFAVTTPEPSSMALLGTGLVGLIPMVRRRRKS